jgi:hypothetical protein
MATKICSHCGASLEEESVFCTACGQKQEEASAAPTLLCKSCSSPLDDPAAPCPDCGFYESTAAKPKVNKKVLLIGALTVVLIIASLASYSFFSQKYSKEAFIETLETSLRSLDEKSIEALASGEQDLSPWLQLLQSDQHFLETTIEQLDSDTDGFIEIFSKQKKWGLFDVYAFRVQEDKTTIWGDLIPLTLQISDKTIHLKPQEENVFSLLPGIHEYTLSTEDDDFSTSASLTKDYGQEDLSYSITEPLMWLVYYEQTEFPNATLIVDGKEANVRSIEGVNYLGPFAHDVPIHLTLSTPFGDIKTKDISLYEYGYIWEWENVYHIQSDHPDTIIVIDGSEAGVRSDFESSHYMIPMNAGKTIAEDTPVTKKDPIGNLEDQEKLLQDFMRFIRDDARARFNLDVNEYTNIEGQLFLDHLEFLQDDLANGRALWIRPHRVELDLDSMYLWEDEGRQFVQFAYRYTYERAPYKYGVQSESKSYRTRELLIEAYFNESKDMWIIILDEVYNGTLSSRLLTGLFD